MSAVNDALMQRAAALQRAGRLQEASQLYQQVLRADAWHFEAYYEMGMILVEVRQFDDAEKFFGEALRLRPRFAQGFCVRGVVLMQLQRRDEALTCFDRALALEPNFPDAAFSRATALLELNRLDEALEAFDKAVASRPDHAMSWNNRGNVFVAMQRLEDAVVCFDRALALEPNLETAINNRNLALLELKRISRLPALAVQTLFDDYSSYYESALASLGYRAPEHLRALLERVSPEARAPLDILDLGCGTGLSGDAFKGLAVGARLDGIDLSPRMIDEARKRAIYTDLIVGDFETVLSAPGPSYDLAIAADAFNYLGDLGPTLIGTGRRLKSGGVCLFTLEKKDGEGWEQTPANRFRHNESYVRSVAAQSGFSVVDIMECALRNESHAPVPGFAIALRVLT